MPIHILLLSIGFIMNFAHSAMAAEKCFAGKVFKDGKYDSCNTRRDDESYVSKSLTEYGCETFCGSPCNQLGINSKYITLGQYFSEKKLPYTVIYYGKVGCQKEAAETYLKAWNGGGTGKLADYDVLYKDGKNPPSCSKLPDGSYAVFYFASGIACLPKQKKEEEPAPATS